MANNNHYGGGKKRGADSSSYHDYGQKSSKTEASATVSSYTSSNYGAYQTPYPQPNYNYYTSDRYDNDNNNNNIKPLIQTIASAPPIKYTKQQQQQQQQQSLTTDQIIPSLPLYQDTPLPKYLLPAPITSYQQAMKAVDTNNQPVYVFPHLAPSKNAYQSQGPKRVVRAAAGDVWEDPTLADWDPDDFRIFVGDLGNEVNDDALARAFSKYGSFQRARVIRDKRTGKSRGYGFVSFKDPADFTLAMREMNGKYIGNRPCKLRKSKWKDRSGDEVLLEQQAKEINRKSGGGLGGGIGTIKKKK